MRIKMRASEIEKDENPWTKKERKNKKKKTRRENDICGMMITRQKEKEIKID